MTIKYAAQTLGLLSALTFAPDGSASAGEASVGADNAYLEIVVYEVADPVAHRQERFKAEGVAKDAMPGMIWWHHLKGEGNSAADIIAWNSPAEAKAAAEFIQSDPRFTSFLSGMTKVVHFGHYHATAEAEALRALLAAAPVTELALYQVADAPAHEAVHSLVHERIQGREGLLGGARLQADGASLGYGDLLTWTNPQAHKATGEAMMAQPDLAPFFNGFSEMKVFALFSNEALP